MKEMNILNASMYLQLDPLKKYSFLSSINYKTMIYIKPLVQMHDLPNLH